MRCRACDKQLNDNESTYKDKDTGEFLDMCNFCRRKGFITDEMVEDDNTKSYIETLFTNKQHN